MKALDLFCGAGGAAEGLKRAGFGKIHGIDINYQLEYPFGFTNCDVFELSKEDFKYYDFIWASPPCQRYSAGGNKESRKRYPDLIGKTRRLLLKTGKPFVIENVPGAPLRKDLMLCGEMFGLGVIRHRIFEIEGFKVRQPNHIKHKGTASNGNYQGVYTGGRCGCFGNKEKRARLKVGSIKDWQKAMGIDWITNRKMLAEAVPPAYSEYIGKEFLKQANEGET